MLAWLNVSTLNNKSKLNNVSTLIYIATICKLTAFGRKTHVFVGGLCVVYVLVYVLQPASTESLLLKIIFDALALLPLAC